MKQVIEVRFINPGTREEVFASADNPSGGVFTQASSHQEAIELALDNVSSGAGKIIELGKWEGLEQGKWDNRGPCFKYFYHVAVEEEEYPRSMMAVLFAQYKEEPAKS
jgi:hypothetical protein